MRSLQLKFSALVVTLLVVASVSLAWIATRHERAALESEVEKRGRAVAKNLAAAAKESLLSIGNGDFAPELTLEKLIEDVSEGEGITAVRLLGADGRIAASLDVDERETSGVLHPPRAGDAPDTLGVMRDGERLMVAAPIVFSGVLVGEAQVEFDLTILIDRIVRSNTEQLVAAAVAVVVFGVVATCA